MSVLFRLSCVWRLGTSFTSVLALQVLFEVTQRETETDRQTETKIERKKQKLRKLT